MPRLYLDTCCYNRPFDGKDQNRLRLESEAVLNIIALSAEKKISLVGSSVLDKELANFPNEIKASKVRKLYAVCREKLGYSSSEIAERYRYFIANGIKPYDALHLSFAERGNVDFFLTVDDRFLKAAMKTDTAMRLRNPVNWLMEDWYDGK